MLSQENRAIAASALATVAGLIALGLVELTVGFPGEWGVVLAFLLVVAVGYVAPQLYLMKLDDSVSRTSRLGVITLVLFVLAAGVSGSVTGTEQTIIWGIVGASIALVVVYEVRDGYQYSMRDATSVDSNGE